MLNHRLLLICLLIISALPGFSQTQGYFKFSTNKEVKQKLTDAIKIRYEKDIVTLQGPNKKHLAEVYKERHDYIKKQLDGIITDAAAEVYLNKLADEIFKANQLLKPSEFRILFLRTASSN